MRCSRRAWRSTPFQQAVSCWSSVYCGFHSSSQTRGVPPPGKRPAASPALHPASAVPAQSGCYIGNAKMMQSTPHFSFPQAFIYSLPSILCLQMFLLREGFLVKAAPARVEVFYSVSFCFILNCLFESQLKPNLIQGFFCLHKERLQKHRRKG